MYVKLKRRKRFIKNYKRLDNIKMYIRTNGNMSMFMSGAAARTGK